MKTNKPKTKILRNIFLSAGALFALAQWLDAGTMGGVLNFNNAPLVHPHSTIITFDVPGSSTGPMRGTQPLAINPMGTIAGYFFDSNPRTHAIRGTVSCARRPGCNRLHGLAPLRGPDPEFPCGT
jgi:hypothetical protein